MCMRLLKYIGVTLLACTALVTSAQTSTDEIVAAFQNVFSIPPVNVVVPTVVEMPISNALQERNDFAIYEVETQKFVPYYVRESFTVLPVAVRASDDNMDASALVDNDSETSAEYFLQEELESMVRITLESDELIESSSLVFELAQYVALPVRVSVSALVNGVDERVIVAPSALTSTVLTFPKTVANKWMVTLTYVQPLRINELRLVQDNVENSVNRGIRFLAQPKTSYMVYSNSDRAVQVPTVERGDLLDSKNVRTLKSVPNAYNPAYKQADIDADGVIDIVDNCVQTANTDQMDIDGNGRGDVCDDFDRDGVLQTTDNCPNHTNVMQEDTDGDGMGDACDTEESRFTEKHAWVPWAGMGVAVLVLGILFALVGMTPKKPDGSQV